MSGIDTTACTRNSWIAGGVGGVLLAALMMAVAGYSLLTALFFGVLFAVLFGLFLVWAFCSASADQMTETRAGSRVAAIAGSAAAGTVAAGDGIAGRSTERRDEPKPSATAPAAASAPAPKPKPAPEPVAERKAEPTPEVKAKPAPEPKAKPAPEPVPEPEPKPAPEAAPKVEAEPNPAPAPEAKPEPKAAPKAKAKSGRPELLTEPRGGKGDDLKKIKGVGPKFEKMLNGIGVWHFDQVASWGADDIAAIDAKLDGFHGRIERDDWVTQAKTLAQGGTTEFSKRVSKGDVY